MGKPVKNLVFKFRVKLRCQRLQKRRRVVSRRPSRPSCALNANLAYERGEWRGRRKSTAGPLNPTERAWYPRTLTRNWCRTPPLRDATVGANPSHAYRSRLNFGTSGFMTCDYAKLRQSCLNAMVQAMRRELSRRAPLHVRVAADRPVTARPAESRMGKGKGALAYWEAAPKPGTVLFEICDARHDPRRLMGALGKKSRLRLRLLH